MGRPKLLLPWGDGTILSHLATTWRALGAAQIAAVIARGRGELENNVSVPAAELDRAGIPSWERIDNPRPELGMFSSIQCAARWNGWQAGLTHWLLTLGDQPHVRDSTLRQLAVCAASHPDKICQPARNGRPRHPVFVPHGVWVALARHGGPETLKQFLADRPQHRECFESDDSGLDFDLDEPRDYERALSLQRERRDCS